MSRRQRVPAEPAADYGAQPHDPAVVIMDRADPDNPNRTVRGAKRRSGYDWLHARGVLSDEQREAADRYAVAHERMSGASERRRAVIARVPPWMQGHPTEAQVRASADIGDVHSWIGGRLNRAVLDGVVVDGKTLDSLSASLSEPVSGIVGRLRACLDIMAAKWGLD